MCSPCQFDHVAIPLPPNYNHCASRCLLGSPVQCTRVCKELCTRYIAPYIPITQLPSINDQRQIFTLFGLLLWPFEQLPCIYIVLNKRTASYSVHVTQAITWNHINFGYIPVFVAAVRRSQPNELMMHLLSPFVYSGLICTHI